MLSRTLAIAVVLGTLAAAAPAGARVLVTIRGDFDGDHKPDRAWMEGWGEGHWNVMAKLSSRPAPLVVEHGDGGYEGEYLDLDPPGRYKPTCHARDPKKCPASVRIRTDAIDISGEEGEASLYYWDGAKFRVIEVADPG